jgi:hypothetical protein
MVNLSGLPNAPRTSSLNTSKIKRSVSQWSLSGITNLTNWYQPTKETQEEQLGQLLEPSVQDIQMPAPIKGSFNQQLLEPSFQDIQMPAPIKGSSNHYEYKSNDHKDQAQFYSNVLSKKITKESTLIEMVVKAKIPEKLRPRLWSVFTKSYDLTELYTLLVTKKSKYSDIIRMDINRTFVDHDLFKSDQGREKLYRILRAYSNYDREVGYCQGLSFFVGALLLQNVYYF